MSNFSIDGLVTGLNTSSIIESLMRIERAPVATITQHKADFDAQVKAWNDIATALTSVSNASNELLTTQKLSLFSASSSAATIATASVTPGATALPSSLSLRVDALATSHQVASQGAASATSALGAGTTTLGVGLPALGIDFASADGAASAGAHAVVVTQATGAASIVGGMWAGSVSMGPADNEVTVVVNGVTRIVQIPQGTYSSLQALAGAVGSAIGSDVNVSAAGGRLQLSTVAEGSAATLQITGGSALANLGLTAGPMTSGTNGVVTVDGVANTIGFAGPGTQTTLNGATGSFTVGLSGGLRAGSGTAHVLRSGSGDTLADLAADISAADSGVRTQTIDVGTGTNPVRLVATASATGLAKAFTLDLNGYTGIADGAETLSQGRNSSVRIGGLSVERATNVLTDIVPGVSVNLVSANPGTEVTLSVNRDKDGLTAKAKALVDSLNAVLNKITSLTKYDADKNVASVFTGDSRARDIATSVMGSLQFTTGSGQYNSLNAIGISVQRNGTYAFDTAKFAKALDADYESVAKVLARSGQAADSRVSFVASSTETVSKAAPYNVVVTQAAQQASVTGSAFVSLASDEDITVTSGIGAVTYRALAGATPQAVADGLNAAFATARNGVSASVSGGAITLQTVGYGAASTLQVTAGATGLTGTSAGVNVAGTIDGVAATGTGQLLTMPTGSGDASGLSLRVSATAADVAGAGGTLNLGGLIYSAGAVGSLNQLLSHLVGTGGKVTTAQAGAVSGSKDSQDRLDAFEQRMTLVQARYTRQFAAMETLMGRLKDQSSWLAAQINGLPGTSS